ncbi:rRNA-processing protein las1 [Ceratobasidium sp. 428]|nr:rRNA-processing protein las1 [Ceratobasidium sp. 428]
MDWLLNRYFLPTLSPSATLENFDLPPLEPLLARYKSIMKAGLKDASLQGRNRAEVDKLMKDIAAWIADVAALYAADSSVRNTGADTPSQKTKLATQRFCEHLCDKGGIVPVSKSKRTQLNKGLGHPSNQTIWAPLIQYLNQQNEYLLDEFLGCMLVVVSDSSTAESDPTFPATVASWVLWAVDTLGDDQGLCRRECVRSLLRGAGPEGGKSVCASSSNLLLAN